MKKTMIATVLGLALMPLTFAAQAPSKPATESANSTGKAVKKHKSHAKKAAAKTNAPKSNAPATNAPSSNAPAPAK
jgi:hypothetical protein